MGLLMHKGKSYGGGLTRLLDMLDVNISNPSNGDGLVYDATAQKWENVPIVTQEMQDILGAKNLLPNEATTQTINGITFTVNADKSVTLNGTSTQAIYFILYTINSSEKNICKAGKRYKISGYNPADASLNWGYVYIVGTSAYSSSVALVSEFDGWEYNSTKYVYLFVREGKTLNNIIVKPMITIASQPNSDYAHYVPYAKTNRELTDLINGFEVDSIPASTYFGSITFSKRSGILFGSSRAIRVLTTVSTSGYIQLGTLPTYLCPKWDTDFVVYNRTTGTVGEMHISSAGVVSFIKGPTGVFNKDDYVSICGNSTLAANI